MTYMNIKSGFFVLHSYTFILIVEWVMIELLILSNIIIVHSVPSIKSNYEISFGQV